MKRIIVGVILILIIIGVGTPFVTGLLMEKVIKQSYGDINKLNTDIGSGVSLEVLHYDRSFSSSEIEWRVNVVGMKAVSGIEEIIFVDQVKHGYTGVVSQTSLAKNQWYTDFLTTKLEGNDPLHITTEYKLSGAITSTVALDAFSLDVDTDVLEIGSGKAVTSFDETLKQFFSEVSWDGMSVSEKFTVDSFSANYNLERISTYIWDGIFSFVLKSIMIDGEKDHVELANLKGDYVLDFNKEQNTLSVGAGLGVDSFISGLEKLEKAFVRIAVNNMDGQGYEDLMKIYTRTVNKMMGDVIAAENDPEEVKKIMEEQMTIMRFEMVAAFEKIMKKGLEIKISELTGQLPEGEVKGDFAISLNRDMTIAQFIPIIGQPRLALDIFSLQSDFSLPQELVGENPMLMAPVYPGMQTGLFEKNGENLVHKAEIRDGKLFINGKELVLE